MGFQTVYSTVALSEIESLAKQKKVDGWRYVQTLAVNTEQGIDLLYSFMKEDVLENVTIKSLGKEDVVPSITESYLAAFVFENEVHDLFGVNISNIAIDFEGNFYRVSQKDPMTIVSPEKLAAREKAAKIAAAKAAKEKAAREKATQENGSAEGADAELEAKLAAMDPEKAAKVRAAMEAKAKKAAREASERKGE